MIKDAAMSGLIIRARMKQLKLTQARLAHAMGRTQAWVCGDFLRDPGNACRRLALYNPEKLTGMLRALRWTPAEFAETTGVELSVAMGQPDRVVGLRRVKVFRLGDIGQIKEENEIGFLMLPETSEGEMGVLVDDAQMLGTVPAGATVVIIPQSEPAVGEIVVGFSREHGPLVRRVVRRDGDFLVLGSSNPQYGLLYVDDFNVSGVVRQIVIPVPGPGALQARPSERPRRVRVRTSGNKNVPARAARL